MSKIGSTVSENVAVLFIRQLFTWASTFVLLLFLPRYLGSENFGKFYLGQSLAAIFMVMIDFGGRYWITKEVSRHRDVVGQIMVDASALRGLLWLFSVVAMNFYAAIAGYENTTRIVIAVFSVGLLWDAATKVIWSCYQGFEIMKYATYSSIASSAFISIVGVTALIMGVGPIGFSVVTVLGGLLSFIICALFIPTMTLIIPKVDFRNLIDHLKHGLPYFLNTLFTTIYYRIDTVMLSLLTPTVVVGWYGASYRFFDALMFVPSILTIAVFPAMSRIFGEGDSISRSFQKSLDFLFLLGVPISIGVFTFSKEIIDLFFGLSEFGPSVLVLKVFACGMIMVYIDFLLGITLLASDKQRQLSFVSLGALFINVGLNYMFIPIAQYMVGNGGIGSALATLITEFFVMFSMLMLLPKIIIEQSGITIQLKTLAAGLIMAGFLVLFHILGIHWIIKIFLSSSVYLGAIVLLKVIDDTDIQLLKGVIPKRFFLKITDSKD